MLGNKIRVLRERKKISQFEIAFALGMSQAAYSKIELGKTDIKVKHLYMIAGALDIPIYDILPPAMASSMVNSNEYLLKPVVDKLKMLFYGWKAKRKLREAHLLGKM